MNYSSPRLFDMSLLSSLVWGLHWFALMNGRVVLMMVAAASSIGLIDRG